MASGLSDRQIKILKAVVEEYTNTAEAVSSDAIEKKYSLGVSPATIRSEMARLTDSGYLRQLHTSAGRIPTSMGLKFYIDQLMEERALPVTDEVAAKEGVWDSRFSEERLLHEAVKVLANRTKSLAVATTEKGDTYHAGYANLLEMPEFYDIDVTHSVLAMLDQQQMVHDLFFGHPLGGRTINVLLGDELGMPFCEPVGIVFSPFRLGGKTSGSLGVIGSVRFNYPQVIPMVKYMSNLLTELGANW